MKIQVSRHAEKRMRERCGLNKKAVERMAEKAYHHGIKHSETKGKLNKWISGKYLAKGKANNIRIYGDKAFVFCDDVLVTVLQVPRVIVKDMEYLVRREK